METDYNGWTNRATWLAHLWLTNDEATQERAAQASYTELQEIVEEMADADSLAGFRADLMNTALGSIDYGALTRAFREEGS